MTLKIPNLAGVITTDDVDQKGSGSYASKYVNWARIANYLHVHAEGWLFHLRQAPDGSHVWKAPNGTGYLVGYFRHIDGQETPDFPQACMDNRNNPVAFEKMSARDVTDTHRRCLCTAAAYTFSLAYELWAKEDVENPHRPEPQQEQGAAAAASQTLPRVARPQPQPQSQSQPQPPAKAPAAVQSAPALVTAPQSGAAPEASPEPPVINPAEQEEADAFASLVYDKATQIGLNHVGVKTLLAILKVEQFQEVSREKRKKVIDALVPGAQEKLNAGKNSRGDQIVDPEYDPIDAEAPSVDDLKARAAAAFE